MEIELEWRENNIALKSKMECRQISSKDCESNIRYTTDKYLRKCVIRIEWERNRRNRMEKNNIALKSKMECR